ncbi:MAG TPA: serine hydrolase domain-containing protein [Burkholderiales bacterium]|nr:serine hydrolase domain-containing protein [Burkholderiales bacterium]
MASKALAGIALAIMACSSFTVQAQELPSAAPESVGMSAARLAHISEAFQEQVDKGTLPGVVVMVARKGKLVYSDALGFQDKGAGKPLAKDAIFRIYSMTKPLVSVAAMTLVEDGKMQLNDPISKFLPSLKGLQVSAARADSEFAKVSYTMLPSDREITVQDLLRHTAGLAYANLTQNAAVKDAYAKNGIDDDFRGLTPEAMVAGVSKSPLIHQPGTVWEYSIAVDVLGRVIEAVSGKRLADYLDERVLSPLGMKDTAFYVPQQKMERLAQALPTDSITGTAIKLYDVSSVPGNDSGGGGAVSTAQDYLRFAQMMANGGELDGTRILARTTVELMTSDHLGSRILAQSPMTPGEILLSTPGYTFGLGFAVRQAPGIAGVSGSQGEFMWGGYAGTYFWIDPKEQLVAVYMTQAPSPIRAYYRKLFKQLVYSAIAD